MMGTTYKKHAKEREDSAAPLSKLAARERKREREQTNRQADRLSCESR